MKRDDRPVFAVRLRAEEGDGVRALRATLKTALRRDKLRCVEAFEVNTGKMLEELSERDEGVQHVMEKYDELIRKLREPVI